MTNVLDSMYNAEGHTLSFGGGKHLSTGVAAFRFHFGPISPAFARTPFGIQSQYQAVCNRRGGLRAGDFLMLTRLHGSGVSPARRFRIDGLADQPHTFRYLSHIQLALSEHQQAS